LIQTGNENKNTSKTIARVVKKIIHHTPEIFEINLSRNDDQFSPGQYLSLFTDQPEVSRQYSIASGINEPWLGFYIKHLAGGQVTDFLYHLQPQSIIRTSRPAGTFRPGLQHGEEDFIFIATGTGIAPFLSYLKSHPARPPLKLLYGIRYLRDAIGLIDFQQNFPIQLAISREKITGYHHGRVTDLLETLPLQENIHYYLCGLNVMIQEVSEWLLSHDIDHHHIHHEETIINP
jgi:ferredoxin-NADP reductase